MTTNSPIPIPTLEQICTSACDTALSSATLYDHSQTQDWNNTIINTILKSLISETSSEDSTAKYKFAVNSTIIQHVEPPTPAAQANENGDADAETTAEDGNEVSRGAHAVAKPGRRGMHSASGAYWNNERDGMWSHKYEGGEAKGMDIVISVMWIGV